VTARYVHPFLKCCFIWVQIMFVVCITPLHVCCSLSAGGYSMMTGMRVMMGAETILGK
jgi:hypothetical protein